MPLRKKLLLSMLLPAFLIVLVGIIGLYSLRHLQQAAGKILSDNYRSIQETRRMQESLWSLEAAAPRNDNSGSTVAHREDLAAAFERALGACEGNITEPGEADLLSNIRQTWNTTRPNLAGWREIESSQSRDSLRGTASLHDQIADLVALNEGAMVAYERETGRVARVMSAVVAASALAAVLALAVFAIVSAGRVSRPVTQLAHRLHEAINPSRKSDSEKSRGEDEIVVLHQEVDDLLGRLAKYEDEQSRKMAHMRGRLAFVINEVLEGLVLVDADRRILAVNRVAQRILGIRNADGLSLDDLEPRGDLKGILAPLMDGTFQPEHDLGELEYAIDGEDRVYRPRVLTIATREDAVEGYLILFWDVTQQRRFEESRRRFISMLSHQLKTPMTSLSMSINLLREKFRDATSTQSELLTIATEDCNSLSSLVSELIDAARDVTPDLTLRPVRQDIRRVVRAALRPILPQAEEKGIELVGPSEGEPIIASVDPVKFPWVVTNIAGNALRYTGRGGRISITVLQTEGRAEVAVADTGKGIAQRDLDRIFVPYFTPDTEREPGTHGLGLAIAKEVVEAHDGTLEAQSELGRGTTFRILLPLAETGENG